MTEMPMRERMARAIGDRYQVSGQRGHLRTNRPPAAVLLDCADAILDAMREPTVEMIRAMDELAGTINPTDTYQLAIDAAKAGK